MDYPPRVWNPTLLPKQPQQQQSAFPSPVSAGPYYFPPQHESPPDPRPGLSLNLAALSVASPPSLSPVGPQLHPHPLHVHQSPITPVSPPTMPLLSPQPPFPYNFDDPDALLSQRRPSTASASDLAVQKSVPRKRSLTNAAPVSPSGPMHQSSHSFSSSQSTQPPVITTTASSPPLPTSSTSSPSSLPSHSHSHSLSHSHSHSSLSLSHSSLSPQRSLPHLEINPSPTSPYDDIDSAGPGFSGFGDDISDDDLGSPSASFPSGASFGSASKPSGSSTQQGQGVIAKSVGTNNFVTKLYHMINDAKSQNFITWTELGTSFVVSNVGEFSRSILGTHFKHNNFSSFVRQLNMYGFHKINRTPRAQRTTSSSQTWEFSHPKFLRGRQDLLEAIKRKALEPDPRERSRVELPGEVARLLTELREENRSLWREIKSLSNRVPSPAAGHEQAIAQVGLGSHVLAQPKSSNDDGERDAEWEDDDGMSGSSMTGLGLGMGASQGGEEWDIHGSRFEFAGANVSGFAPTTFGAVSGDEEWRRWAQGEIIKERKRVQRLVGVVKALVNGNANAPSSVKMDGDPDGVPPGILQELHDLSLSFDTSPSPMAMPSPSPSPSPHSFSRHQHSPNIFITEPTSPSLYTTHSRSPRDAQTHPNPNAPHAILPTLSIPTGPSPFSLHTPSSSPTTSDFVPGFFTRPGHGRSLSHLGVRISRPNITLTPDTDNDGRAEKRARTENDRAKDGSDTGLQQEMDIIPNEAVEDIKLPSPVSLTGGMSPTTATGLASSKVVGSRSRSDSAPMWEGGSMQGGLSANWTGRGRSGSAFGQC